MNFCRTSPCNNCPYRKDAPRRLWHISEFINLKDQESEQFGSVFGCHKKDGHICVGYLMKQDERRFPNLNLRIMLSRQNISRDYLDKLHCKSPMFDTVEEMIEANYPEITKTMGRRRTKEDIAFNEAILDKLWEKYSPSGEMMTITWLDLHLNNYKGSFPYTVPSGVGSKYIIKQDKRKRKSSFIVTTYSVIKMD